MMIRLSLMLMEASEEMTNITPALLRFLGRFALVFVLIGVLAVLTPKIAAKIDEMRAHARASRAAEDPRCADVRGIYDLPPMSDTDESPKDL